MSEYRINEAVGVWTAMCPQTTREAHTKGRITTLIDLSKEGDTKANKRLLHEFTPTIEMLAKDMCNFNNSDADLKEAKRVAREAFDYAVRSYDHERTFDSHMKLYVIGELSKFLTQ
ncbi:MAG: hypothetical protein NTW67_04440 [Candidatus Woesearchaeota archaeon]|nr:hypothetical protein [Candidatus Woesearchaeota archaeon]